MNENECIFCQIARGEIASKKVYEDEVVLAFYDNFPSADHHVLIIPKKHLGTFLDLDDSGILDDMRRVAQKLIRELDLKDGYRLIFNGGRYQKIPHVHWHLLAGELKKPFP